MSPDFVADVGNSRIKWGRCRNASVSEIAALPHADPAAWEQQLDRWQVERPSAWAVSGVHPASEAFFVNWLRERGHAVKPVRTPSRLPLRVKLERPDLVGMDRLLDAVAANHRRAEDGAAVIVDAGTAVTVDYVDGTGAFCGGAILPGLRLMARSLHEQTALLPPLDVHGPTPLPGRCTEDAMRAGVFWAVAGGITALVQQTMLVSPSRSRRLARVFLTGGDATHLAPVFARDSGVEAGLEWIVWPEMTLEGIRLAAQALV